MGNGMICDCVIDEDEDDEEEEAQEEAFRPLIIDSHSASIKYSGCTLDGR